MESGENTLELDDDLILSSDGNTLVVRYDNGKKLGEISSTMLLDAITIDDKDLLSKLAMLYRTFKEVDDESILYE